MKPKTNLKLTAILVILLLSLTPIAFAEKENDIDDEVNDPVHYADDIDYSEDDPEEKVFVDNRPEAYSVKFFREVYIPMQEDEKVWEKVDDKYKFNVIYFYRHDITPWAQPFLIERVKDPKWIPVFVDDYTIIFVKNSIENKALIDKYEIPKEIFGQN